MWLKNYYPKLRHPLIGAFHQYKYYRITTNGRKKVYPCNLFETPSYSDILKDADVLFHLAAENTTSMANASRVLENTDKLTQVVLQACHENQVQNCCIYQLGGCHRQKCAFRKIADRSDVNEFPESPYVKGKMLAERYVENFIRQHNYDIRRVYPSWVVGTNDAKLTHPIRLLKIFWKKAA